MLKARVATASDAIWMAPRLREADRREVFAAGSEGPLASLLNGVLYSMTPWAAVDEEDRPVALCGLVPTADPLVGSVWLLATDEVAHHRISFLRRGQQLLETFHLHRPVLGNFVDERNTVHIEWLRWLGFTFINRHPQFGPERRPFLEFVRLDHVLTSSDGGGQLRNLGRLPDHGLHG